MNSVAFKWRISTTEYVYLTSTAYDNRNPKYNLGGITTSLSKEDDEIIANHVKNMSRDDYHACFDYIMKKVENYDLNFKNWEYYYNMSREGCSDCSKEPLFYTGATATAQVSPDGSADAYVSLENGILNFSFLIPKGNDGKDGVDGINGLQGEPGKDGVSLEYIYVLDKIGDVNALPNPNELYGTLTPNKDNKLYHENNFIPDGWTDSPSGISVNYKYEWVSTRKRDGNGKWDKFTEPKLMSRWGEDGKDGDGIEYIYKLTKTEEKPNDSLFPNDWESNSDYQKNDEYCSFIGKNWTPDPMGISVTNKYEWVSVRKQEKGVWQKFTEPKIWARWGEDGDGIEYIYCITSENEPPTTPTVDESDYQTPNYFSGIWSDEYIEPTFNKKFGWVSQRKLSKGIWGEFTEPKIWNTYKTNGKVFVDLYATSNNFLIANNLPSYSGTLYYSFEKNKFYSDIEGKTEKHYVNGGGITWVTEMPTENTSKYLFKTSARISLTDDFTELIGITENDWCGPYAISTNGSNSLHVELSNDMDQVYITDEKVIVKDQTIETTISVFDGAEKLNINYNDIHINEDSKTYFNANVENINETDVKLILTLTGETIPLNTKNIDVTINIDVDYYGIPLTLDKTFRVKVLNGVIDYDVVYTPSFIKRDKRGNYSTYQVNVSITKRDLVSGDRETLKCSDLKSEDMSLRYFFNNNVDDIKELEDDFISLPNYDVNRISLALYHKDEVLDDGIIECIHDGVDGSAYHLETTNEYEQVHTINKKILPNQSFTLGFTLFNGLTSINDFTLSIPNSDEYCNIEKYSENEITFSFKNNVELDKRDINYIVSAVTSTDEVIEKRIKFIVLNGSTDYDINASQTYVKKIGDNITTSAITVTVTKTELDTNNRTISTLSSLTEENLILTVYVDGNVVRVPNYGENGITILRDSIYPNLTNSIEIELKQISGDTVIDYVKIEVVKDGVDGNDGNDGITTESIYFLTTGDTFNDVFYEPDNWSKNINYQNPNFCPFGWTKTPSGISETFKYEWISCRKNNEPNNKWGRFTKPVIYAKWGENGKDGEGVEYIYKLTTGNTPTSTGLTPADWSASTSTYQTGITKNGEVLEYVPSGWTDNPSGTTSTYKYEWVSIRKRTNGIWQPFSTPVIWSSRGSDGKSGASGKMIYPAGAWKSGTTYTSTSTAAPFVSYGTPIKYYVLQIDKSTSGTTPDKLTNEWLEMSKYEAIYTDIIVAENGLIGGSVYNSDYVLSKNGTINSTASTEYNKFLNTSLPLVDMIFSGDTDYHYVNTFIPNYLVDFNKGRAWFGNGNTILKEDGSAIFGNGKTIINKNGVIYTEDLVNSYTMYNLPLPSPDNMHGNGMVWDYSGVTIRSYDNYEVSSCYLKRISTLNSFIFDDYLSCVDTPEVISIIIEGDLVANKWYKGDINFIDNCGHFYLDITHYYDNTHSYNGNYQNKHGYFKINGKSKIDFLFRWDGKTNSKYFTKSNSISYKTGEFIILNNYDLSDDGMNGRWYILK